MIPTRVIGALRTGAFAIGALALSGSAPITGVARADAIPPAIARALTHREGWPQRWPRSPLLDRARDASEATIAWERTGTLGEGATVCVVDTGIDARHPDFLDAEGRTRVRWLVELGGSPRSAEPDLERRYGAAIWSASAIDAAIAGGGTLPGDRHGHGTAIASIAAGDDAGTGERDVGPLAGIAPRAQLIVVRALRDGALGFEDADVVAGVELCFALAGRGDAPTDVARTVALIALGGHDGAHDGTEPLERALADVARGGHAIVVAAGNDGTRAIHAAGRGLPGAPGRVGLHLPSPRDVEEPFAAIAVRTEGSIAIVTPRGEMAIAEPGLRTLTEHAGGYILIDAGEDVTRIVIGGGGSHFPLHAGDYEIVIEGATFDAWLIDARLGAALGAPALTGDHVLAGDSVTIPATSTALVAVGASVSRGVLRDVSFEARSDGSAASSSSGPSASGAARPDLMAPGGVMTAALSQDLVPDDPTNLIGGSRPTLDRRIIDGDRIAIEGSSAAAAVVAGAYALAYSLAPADLERDRALLSATAGGAEAWTPTTGAGALRIDAWLRARQVDDDAITIDAARSSVSTTRSVTTPRARDVLAIGRMLDADGRPVSGGELVIRSRGRELGRAPIAHGHVEVALQLEGAAGDTITIEPVAGEIVLAPRTIEVRIDEGPRGLARAGGGGHCAAMSGRNDAGRMEPARLSIALGAAVIVALRARRARRRA